MENVRDQEGLLMSKVLRHREHVRTHRQKNRVLVNERARVVNARRRTERDVLLHDLKSKPCVDCKESFPYFVMDFDHREPEQKKANISELKYGSLTLLLEEVAKCDLVCRNCHALRTHGSKVQSENKHPRHRANQDKIYLLKQAPCIDCCRTWSPSQMDFDHVRGEKLANVSQLVVRSWSVVEAEISKCDLVCANCHRVRTQIRARRYDA